MKRRKLLALLLSLCLLLPLCAGLGAAGAFATGTENDTGEPIPVPVATDGTVGDGMADGAVAGETSTPVPDGGTTGGTVGDGTADGAVAGETPTPAPDGGATGGTMGDGTADGAVAGETPIPLPAAGAEGTPDVEAPASQTPAPPCTCEATDEEKAAEGFVHAAGCPLYIEETADSLCASRDGLTFRVNGTFPAEAQLQITALSSEAEQYIHYSLLGLEELSGDYSAFAYDIKVVCNGETFTPEGQVQVVLTGTENDADSDVAVYHLPGTDAAIIEKLAGSQPAAAARSAGPLSLQSGDELTADGIAFERIDSVCPGEGRITFTTDGFSVYYIVSGTKAEGDPIWIDSNNSVIYAMPGAEFTFARTIRINNSTRAYDDASFSKRNNSNTITVKAGATIGAQLSLTYQYGWSWERYSVTIIVGTAETVVQGAIENCPVLLAVLYEAGPDTGGIPNEPGDTKGRYIHIERNSSDNYYTTGTYNGFASTGSGIIAPDIWENPDYFVHSVDGSSTYGVYDASGKNTLAALVDGSIDWDKALAALVSSNYAIIAADGTTVTEANMAQYRLIPYVVKYKSQSFMWHIDCAVVNREYVTLTYLVNFSGSEYVTTSLRLPGAVSVEKGNSTTVGYITDNGRNLNVGDKITVTDVESANGQTTELTFQGWNTQADGLGTYYSPGDFIVLNADTYLYAIWTSAVVTGDLKISKTVETRSGSSAAPSEAFTFTVTLSVSGSYDYTVYGASGEAQRTGTITSGGTLALRGGQYAVIHALPVNAAYTVTESALDYYTTAVSGGSGKIAADAVQEAAFTNTYARYTLTTAADAHSAIDEGQTYGYAATETILVEFSVTEEGYAIDTVTVDGAALTGDALAAAIANGSVTVDKRSDHSVSVTTKKTVTSLTISKTGCQTIDHDSDEQQSFLFHVTGGGLDLTIAIQGNGEKTISGLRVGETYTVEEITDWSWRYMPASGTQSKTLVADAGQNTLTFSNSRNRAQWLSGDNAAINKRGTSQAPRSASAPAATQGTPASMPPDAAQPTPVVTLRMAGDTAPQPVQPDETGTVTFALKPEE